MGRSGLSSGCICVITLYNMVLKSRYFYLRIYVVPQLTSRHQVRHVLHPWMVGSDNCHRDVFAHMFDCVGSVHTCTLCEFGCMCVV